MRDYKQIAGFLQGLKKDANARVFYDFFADALVWSDEIPPADSPDRQLFSAADLRGLWRFRSTLIMGKPEAKFAAAWDEALKCFPNWPGFDPSRRDTVLASLFSTEQAAVTQKWEEAEDRINDQLAAKSRKMSA